MIIRRNTIQRQILLDALKKLNTHPSVDEIYAEVKKSHPAISKSTTYRNLRQLAEGGIIRQVSFPDGLERYDGNVNQHYHFRCNACGGVYDVDIEHMTGVNDRIQQKYGFRVERHDIVFSGCCKKCGQPPIENNASGNMF